MDDFDMKLNINPEILIKMVASNISMCTEPHPCHC